MLPFLELTEEVVMVYRLVIGDRISANLSCWVAV